MRITSSQAALRFAAGTLMVPARARKSGVRARRARLPSTRNTTSSPSLIPSASRTALGTVTWPFDVTFAAASTLAPPYLAPEVRVPLLRPDSTVDEQFTRWASLGIDRYRQVFDTAR